MTNNISVITVDGPSSSGKGTISFLLAKKLGWHLLDSGAVYRVLAYLVSKNNISQDDVAALTAVVNHLNIQFVIQSKEEQRVIVGNEDVTLLIRDENCGKVASKLAAMPEVRTALLFYFQRYCLLPGLVADGRDMGTVVFPNAKFKIFLTASVEKRALRRLLQLQQKGINATLADVLQGLIERDERDQNRSIAPLKPDPAAMIVDTTKMSVDEVLQLLMEHIKTNMPN